MLHISANNAGTVTPRSLFHERPILREGTVWWEGSGGGDWVSFLPSLERGGNEEREVKGVSKRPATPFLKKKYLGSCLRGYDFSADGGKSSKARCGTWYLKAPVRFVGFPLSAGFF